jgi:glycosyltransferase involved in cell wall biosynthesis
MNIGIITADFLPYSIGGVETKAALHARELTKLGNKVIIFARAPRGAPRRETKDGYLVVRRTVPNLPLLRFVSDLILGTLDIFRYRKSLDITISYMFIINGLHALLARRLFGIPYVVWIMDEISYRLDDSLRKRILVPPVIRMADLFLFQAEIKRLDFLGVLEACGQSALKEYVKDRGRVVQDGIDLDPKAPYGGDKLLFIGRLVDLKGVDILLEALRKVPEAPELLIVGDGPEGPRLRRLAKGMNVTFVGEVPPEEVNAYIKRAKFLVAPSYSEGVPSVILESFALAVPAVTTPVGGIPEVVTHEFNGLLVEPGNPELLADAIRRLLNEKDLHGTLARNAYETARAIPWDKVMRDFLSLLKPFARRSERPGNPSSEPE